MKNNTLLLLLFISTISYSQYTSIPDANFETSLAPYDDIPADGQVPTANISGLTTLDVSGSSIADLTGIHDFSSLTSLNCSNNSLTYLNTFEINGLITLISGDNNLTQLVYNSNLEQLICRNNSLTSLDLRLNTSLNYLECQNNNLYSLNLKNGNNATIGNMIATSNNLTCLNVDDAVNAAAGTGIYSGLAWAKDGSANYSETCDTYVPDDNFEQELINLGYDTILDNFVTTANINTVTFLSISSKSISDLTGISGFSSLTSLFCSTNNIDLLDLSHNPNLVTVSASQNQFKGIYVQNSPNLITLNCLGGSQLNNLDISQNTLLQTLDCTNTGLKEINLSQNTQLSTLKVSNNQLSNIDISQLSNLDTFWCAGNLFTEINLTNNTQLTDLDCSNNNSLVAIDLKQNSLLTSMDANPNAFMTCIQVADVVAANAGTGIYSTWTKSAGTNYSEFCLEINTYVPDNAFEQKLIDLGYDTNLDDYVVTNNTNTVTSLNLNNLGISDLTGIEAFTAIQLLNCNNNSLTTIDLSQNTNLLQFRCFNNTLTSLDVSNNTLLTDLRCGENSLTSLDVSQNTSLTQLRFQTNQINEIYINMLPNLEVLYAYENNLTRLNIGANLALTSLLCYDNDISALDLSQNSLLTTMDAILNTNLTCIQVTDATAATAGTGIYASWLKDISTTYAIDCGYIQETFVPDDNFEQELINLGYDTVLDNFVITSNINTLLTIDLNGKSISDMKGIEDFSMLGTLLCSSNTISNLDVSNNNSLSYLVCNDNGINSLLLPPSINTLYCYNNNLSTLDLTNTNISHLRAYSNNLTTIDLTNSPNLEFLNIGFNNLTSIDISNNLLLETLIINTNNLTEIDLRYHNLLTELSVAGNNLTDLNLTNKSLLTNTMNATNNSNLTCIQVDDVVAANANVFWSKDVGASYNIDCGVNTSLAVKAFLQGPLITSGTNIMDDSLRVSGYIPTTSPFIDNINCNANLFIATGNDAIIDWVYIELRDKTDNSIIIEGQSGLLQADGDIVAKDGLSDLIFLANMDDYYIVVKHRNHIGIMSSIVHSLSSTTALVDFSSSSTTTLGGTNAVISIGGIYALYAGDFDGDGQVLNSDIQSVISLAGISGYSNADADMNGQILNTDIQNIIRPNAGKGQQF